MAQIAKADLKDMPDDVADLLAPHIEGNDTPPEMLAAIGLSLASKRESARAARQQSGIEKLWKDCEEAYVGIDDANRNEFQDARWSKPMSMQGPLTTSRLPRESDHKATVYIRLTARYVDAAASKVAEIILSPEDRTFKFSEMPVPHVIAAKEDKSQVIPFPGSPPLTRPAQAHEIAALAAQSPPNGTGTASLPTATAASALQTGAMPQAPATAPQVPITVRDLAEENIELARKKAKKAEDKIWGWLVQCNYRREARKMIFDAARIGTGIIKGPIPEIKKSMAYANARIKLKEVIVPAVKWVDPWNIFPDPACGDNIHDGSYVFERDYLSALQLRKLRDEPGYIPSEIDAVLEEGPSKSHAEMPDDKKRDAELKARYEVWYYFGLLSASEMGCLCRAGNGNQQTDPASEKDQVYAIVTVVNDRAIRAVINPLDTGSFPYHSLPWQRRGGHWAGIGVAEQIIAPQAIVNAAERAMLNNAGKSAGSQLVIRRGAIIPADGDYTVTPDKIWYATDDAPPDIRESIMPVEIPNTTAQLLSIIEHAMQMAEESTSIPLITQGESGATSPNTATAANLQNTNANQLLRSIGYAFDDYINEPMIRQFYEWWLLDPDVADDDKGEFEIDAHGSVAMVDRAIENQAIGQMGNLVLTPAYGFNPKSWAKQFMKANRLDPEDFQYTEEEQRRIDAEPPAKPPQVQAAEVNADATLKVAVMKQSAEAQSQESEERIAAAANALESGRVQNEQVRAATEATVKLHELQLRRELAMLEHANSHGLTLMQVKAQLAGKAMELQTQRELNAADNAVAVHKHANPAPERERPGRKPAMKPPVQAPGRAGNGRAFEQSPQ